MKILRSFSLIILFWAGAKSAFAFALLGPFAPWMTAQLSYQDGFSIGGPMDVGQGYRWNVPVVTYGYDPSFIEYFGTNGVAAVEAAIQMLNDIPPASSVVLTNYPLDTTRVNYRAEALDLMDVKSVALAVVLEEMGLAQPSRFIYCLRNFTNTTHYTAIMRNFDPITFAPSPTVNGVLYGYAVFYRSGIAGTSIFVEDPNEESSAFSAVADYIDSLFPGVYYTGLTMDDVAGICYLLSTNNIAPEPLYPGVTGYGTNASDFVTTALRPGVDKVTFVRLNSDPLLGQFVPMTNQYVDAYITNGTLQHQSLQRVITQPDILFTARYNGFDDWERTGTGNWVNMGAPSNAGPGVIQPPVEINFNRLGPSLYNAESIYPDTIPASVFDTWGSFDGSTNPPVIYPNTSGATNMTEFHLWLAPLNFVGFANDGQGIFWDLHGTSTATFLLQTSTDLSNWGNVTTLTNLGGTYTYLDFIQPNTPQRFFRTVPQ